MIINSIKNKNEIVPNKIQEEALINLNKLRENGLKKALVVAATGIGKTFLAAFDVKQFKSQKTLFIVHRDEILQKAKETFEKVIPNSLSTFFKGDEKNKLGDIVFASIQTISRNLDKFKENEFEYLIIDEAHHASADTYKKVLDFFKPKFTLGMTATPERMDGANIWEIFENNVAIDVRLKDAIDKDVITTFHYFGVSELNSIDLSNVQIEDVDKVAKKLMINERVDYIIEQINIYKYSGTKMFCVAFCVNKEHAKYMAFEFNKRGIVSEYLTSDLDSKKRKEIIEKFQDDQDPLSVIFAVDILNEGVDIPKINLVLFLRPTSSPIIFIQQLGRGLRKQNNKKFLTVLDFIANHSKTYLVPYALASFNHASINERNIYDMVKNDFKSFTNFHIEFDKVSKEKIFNSILNQNTNSSKWIKWEYEEFKKSKNTNLPIKYLCNYLIDNAPDVFKIIKKYKNYLNFVWEIERDEEIEKILSHKKFGFFYNYLSKLLPIYRINEFILLFHLITNNNGWMTLEKWREIVDKYTPNTDEWSIKHSLKCLNFDKLFFNEKDLKEIEFRLIEVNEKNEIKLSNDFNETVNNEIFKKYIIDCLEFGIQYFLKHYNLNQYQFPFLKIGQRYKLKEALSINQDSRNFSSMFGAGVYEFKNNFYFSFNLNKKEDTKEELKYENGIEIGSRKIIYWSSQNSSSQNEGVGKKIIEHKKKNIDINIFIRKYDTVDRITQPFIYLGKANVVSYSGNKPIKFVLELEKPMSDEIYYELMSNHRK